MTGLPVYLLAVKTLMHSMTPSACLAVAVAVPGVWAGLPSCPACCSPRTLRNLWAAPLEQQQRAACTSLVVRTTS